MTQHESQHEPHSPESPSDDGAAETGRLAVPLAEAAPAPAIHGRRRAARKWRRPIILFWLTAASTFFVGCTWWSPGEPLAEALFLGDAMSIRGYVLENWLEGLLYMVCVMLILGAHELGHFFATVYYRIPASLPYFIPMPFTPIGTMGALIAMDGRQADRKQVFDIGLAGPLAGLVFAIPLTYYGVTQLNLNQMGRGGVELDLPLAVQWMMHWSGPDHDGTRLWLGWLKGNPCLMAGWFGLLITGVNMMPVGQLDGGHVTYALFGKRSYWLARAFMLVAFGYVILCRVWIWMLMLLIVSVLIGVRHPPTRDDSVALGWARVAIGLASLAIPVVCFPIRGFIVAP